MFNSLAKRSYQTSGFLLSASFSPKNKLEERKKYDERDPLLWNFLSKEQTRG